MTPLDPSTVATMQGRELDAAIHERLFDEEPCDCVPATGIGRFNPTTGRCVLCGGQAAPRYSTDYPAFFAVIEKVRESGWRWNAGRRRDGDYWVCMHTPTANAGIITIGQVTSEANTLPLAFARAALLTTYYKEQS